MSQFECDGCGACCCTFPVFVAESDAVREPRIWDEGRRLPLWVVTPQWNYQLFPLPFHEACCFLDIDVCRQFGAGSAQCQEARRERRLPQLMEKAANS